MHENRTRLKSGPKPRPIADRFWPRVNKTDTCWLWTGATSSGYGVIGIGGHDGGWAYAHRLSWEWTNGPIPAGMYVLHRCDVPRCCNPDHLFIGTQADNIRDMVIKRRGWRQQPGNAPKGEQHPMARLTEGNVRALRARWHVGESFASLAQAFGITTTHARRIALGEAWRHVYDHQTMPLMDPV